jgi:NAD(P)-dependent dehydrogenase (short-subunit alcohol dehydrogenase family)
VSEAENVAGTIRLPGMPSFRLDGQRALVTGASRGIGLAAATALAGAGAHVTLVARHQPELDAALAAIRQAGGTAEALAIDVLDVDALREALAERDPFSILVNNAGTNRPASFVDVTTADFDTVFSLNVRAAFFVAQIVAQRLCAAGLPGSIIHMSSQMAHVGGARRSVYCASKHALEGLTKAMAIDLAPSGIRVNTICPTFIETDMTAGYFQDEAFRTGVLQRIKLGRIGKVEDLMGAIILLASDASSLITGTSIVIDGGWTAE